MPQTWPPITSLPEDDIPSSKAKTYADGPRLGNINEIPDTHAINPRIAINSEARRVIWIVFWFKPVELILKISPANHSKNPEEEPCCYAPHP